TTSAYRTRFNGLMAGEPILAQVKLSHAIARRSLRAAETLQPLDQLVDRHAGCLGRERDHRRSWVAFAGDIGLALPLLIVLRITPPKTLASRGLRRDDATAGKAGFPR